MNRELRSEDIRQAIAEVGAKESPSSYSDYERLVQARLCNEGFSIDESQRALVRQVLREVAPLGLTDVDDRIAAKTGAKPWYIALAFFVLVCAAGGVIEYFVQRGLDKVVEPTKGGLAERKSVPNEVSGKTYLIAIDKNALWRDRLAKLVLEEPRFQLLDEQSQRKYDAKIFLKELSDGHLEYKFLSGDDVELAEKVIEPGPADIIINALCHHFTVEGYILFVQGDEFWCDLTGKHAVKLDDRLVILRKKGEALHPVTKELVPLGEELIGKAKIVEVGEESSRAKVTSVDGVGRPMIGDKVRVGLGFSSAPRPWKRRFVVSVDWKSLTVTSDPQKWMNETDEPVEYYTYQDGKWSPFSHEAVLIVDGVKSRPGQVEELSDGECRVRITYPKPVKPGQTIVRTLQGKVPFRPIPLPDGSFQYSTIIGQKRHVVEQIVVVELPADAKFVKSNSKPVKMVSSGMGSSRETLIFNIQTTPQETFELKIDFCKRQ